MTDVAETLIEAVDVVKGAGLDPETPGGAAALTYVLRVPAARDAALAGGAPEPGKEILRSSGEPHVKLAQFVGVDPDRLLDVIEFEPDQALLRIRSARLGRAKADRQRVLVLLKLAVDRVAFGSEEVAAQRVNSVCADYACLDQNLAHNIAHGHLVARRGKRGAYVYRATQPGMERARELLMELVAGEGDLRV